MSSTVASQQAVPLNELESVPSWAAGYDRTLLGATIALLAIGAVMVASASIDTAARDGHAPLAVFWRHCVYVLLALGVLGVSSRLELSFLQRVSPYLLIGGIVLLALVLLPGIGREVHGSTRWIGLGPLSLQPSEFVKVGVVLYMSGYLVRRAAEVREDLSGFFKPVAILVVIAGLLLLEPDFGATVVVFATALGMLFLGGVPLRTFAGWMIVIVGALAVILFMAPYRLERLMTFLNPWAHPWDSGFQLIQALIAIGRGEWFGVGLGASVQKLFYLPEAHTDFLLAVLGEELGCLGICVVLALFMTIVWRGFAIARNAARNGDSFGAHLAHGITLLVGLQAFVNAGVNLGVLPTKGLTLPLMSFGGSSLLASCLAIGLLLRVEYESRRVQ
jgi:cell division protein FtsW